MKKTLGELIDELCIVNIKIFAALNIVEAGGDVAEVAKAALAAEKLNKRRSSLRNAIDEAIGDEGTSVKVYARPVR